MTWHDGVATGIGRPAAAGLAALALGFGGFGAWAGMAPLKGAVIAGGRVVASDRNKVVQHLEGGIVKSILVSDGDKVRAGQALIELDATASRALLNRLKAQLRMLRAVEARVAAERDGGDAVAWPRELLAARAEPEVAALMEDQAAEFEARLKKHRAEIAVLEQQAAALREEIAGYEVQKEAVARQIGLSAAEREPLEGLYRQGLTTKTRKAELERMEADLQGRKGQLAAAVAGAKKEIAEIGEKVEALRTARLEEASTALSEARAKQSDIQEQIGAAQDVLNRVIVTAPASGTVMNLAKHNAGAVVAPGQPLLEIVPDTAELIVEAHVRPQDVDEVHVGQDARLVFSAFDPRVTPQAPGKVAQVSADRLQDERSGEAYYLVKLTIAKQPPPGFDLAKVTPGQPAEAFITTQERTFLQYLLEPFAKTIQHALKES